MRLQAREHIAAPPHDVFRFVATEHFTNHPSWDHSIVEMEQTSTGPMRSGSTARVVREEGGRRMEGTVTVTDHVPDSHFAAVVEFGPFRLAQEAMCSPGATSGTDLVLVIDSRARGPVRLMIPFMRKRFARTMRASLRSIKQQIEGRSAG